MRKTLLVAFLAFVGMQAQAQYCSGGPSSTTWSQIDLVELNGELGSVVDSVVPCASAATGLTDLTASDTAIVYRDSSYTLSVRAGNCTAPYVSRLTVYVDWNMNGSFENYELVGYINGLQSGATPAQTFNLNVPSGISVGTTRMRIIQEETSTSGPSDPCATFTWGSMNDYSITVAGPASSCPTPYALQASGVGADEVTLSWTTSASSTMIAAIPSDSAVSTATFVSYNGLSATLSGLMSDVNYTVYAYDACGSDTVMVNFRTLCSVFATPFSENFDGGSFVAATDNFGGNGYLNSCWTSNDYSYWNGNLYPHWVVGEGTTPSGSSLTSTYSAGPIGDATSGYGNYMFVEGGGYSYGGYARLETPLIDLNSLTEPYLTFDAHLWQNYQSASYTPKMSIEISNDNGISWTKYQIQEGPFDSQPTKASAYENIGVALSSFVGDTVKIAFVLEDHYSYNDLAIDNIVIDEAPSCYAPIVSVDSVSYNWVTFNSLTYLGTSYYYTTANATAKTSGSLTASPDTVSNLTSDSTYSFYFYSDCSTAYSDTIGPITITPPTFNACGPNTVYPYTETFETNSARKGCWTTEIISGSRDWDVNSTGGSWSGPSAAAEGSMFAELDYASSGSARLISPVMDMSAYATGQVTFQYHNEAWGSDQNTLVVEYRLSSSDPWVQVWSNSTSAADWTEGNAVALGTSNTMQFAFRGDLDYGYNMGLDSIVFDQGPTCVAPINVVAFDVTSNSASLTWSGLTQNYSIDYGVVGAVATVSSAANDTTSISGLTASTSYFAVITADCGGGTYSDPSDTVFFTTACLPDSVGYYEDIESATGSSGNWNKVDIVPTSCWAYLEGSAGFPYYYVRTSSSSYPARSGTNQYFMDNGALATPFLYGLGDGDKQFRFYAKGNSTYNVWAANDQAVGADTIFVGNFTPGGTSSWAELTMEIPALPAGYDYLWIESFLGSSYRSLYLDDFYYELQPTCKPATGAEFANISNSSVDLNVFSKAGGGNWQVELVEPFLNSSTNALDFSQGTGTLSTISNATGTLSGLGADSTYGVWVRQLCGAGDTSDWRGPYIFKTECNPVAVFPYVMEFESDWEMEKGCWDTINSNLSSFDNARVFTAPVYSWATYTQSSRNMRFYATSSGNSRARTQPLTIPATGASLGFKYGAYDSAPTGTDNEFFVLVREQGTAAWDTIGHMQGEDLVTSSSSSYDIYNVGNDEMSFMVPASLSGKDVVFSLEYKYNSFNGPTYFNIDSLYLGTPPACPDPMNLAQVSATASSVTVEWLSPLGLNKGSRVRWGTTSFLQATGAGMIGDTNAVTSPFTITGLAADSVYHVFVQDSCSVTDTTAWLGPIAVRTACDVATAPYVMTFDNPLDVCWKNEGGSSQLDIWRSTSSSTPAYGAVNFKDHTANNGAAMYVDASYASNSNPPVLTSRSVDITTLTQPELEFYVGSYNVNNNDSNVLVVNIIDANGKTDSAVVFSGMSPDWQRIAVDLATYTSPVTAEFVVYMDDDGTSVFYNDIVVDGVSFDEKRSCFAASNAVASNVAANSATVSWDAGSASGTDWVVNVTNSLTGAATTYSATSTSLNLSGLSGGGDYCVTVQEVCSATGDTTTPTSPVCFTTQCGTVYAPYVQDFAAYNYDFNCWSRSTNVVGQGTSTLWTGTYGDWMVGGVENKWGNPSSGTYPSTAYNYAIGVDGSAPFAAAPVVESPMIDVSALFKPQLKFHTISGQAGDTVITWLGDTISNGQNTLVVDLWDGAAWNDSVYVNNSDTVAWDSVLIELNQYNVTGPVQVRFTVNKTAVIPAFDDILVDNFAIEDDPAILTCSDIDSAYAFDMNCGDAMIAWGTVDTSGVFTMGSADTNRIGTVVYVGTDSLDMMAGMKYFTTDTAAFVDGLTPGTDYFFWAMDSCVSGNTSGVIGPFHFTTDTVPMPTVPSITSVNDTVTTTSDWTFTLTGDSTQVYTWDIDGMTYTGMVANPSFTSNDTVDVTLTIANDCGSMDTTFQVVVTQIGQEENILADAKIYPNPSNGNFNVEFSSIEGLDYSIQIMDAMGRVISTKEGVTAMNNTVRIDANLPSGVYIVKTIVGSETMVDRVSIRN